MLTATLAAYSSQRLPLFQMIDIIRDDIGRLVGFANRLPIKSGRWGTFLTSSPALWDEITDVFLSDRLSILSDQLRVDLNNRLPMWDSKAFFSWKSTPIA